MTLKLDDARGYIPIFLVETNQLYIRSIITAEPEWVFREGKCRKFLILSFPFEINVRGRNF